MLNLICISVKMIRVSVRKISQDQVEEPRTEVFILFY